MSKYIKPTLTITANSHDASSMGGPTTSPIAISVTDDLDVTEVVSKVIDTTTTHGILFENSAYATAITAGSEGAFIFLMNHTSTADIYIGHGSTNDLADGGLGETIRLMTLKPKEFAFFPYDLEHDIIYDASAAVAGGLEAIMFIRTGTE